jgi:hypothetical protein
MVSVSRIGASVAFLFVASLSFAQSSRPTRPVVVHAVNMGACNFRFSDSFGGRVDGDPSDDAPVYATYLVELPRKTLPATFHISFGCDTRDPVQVCHEFARVEHTARGWVMWDYPDEGALFKTANVKVRELRSVNGTGAVQLHNQPESAIGPASRSLGFCLTAPNGATLFGHTIVDEFSGRHKSVQPEVMQLLRSIEFMGSSASPAKAVDP